MPVMHGVVIASFKTFCDIFDKVKFLGILPILILHFCLIFKKLSSPIIEVKNNFLFLFNYCLIDAFPLLKIS